MSCRLLSAQDGRTQYPSLLSDSYFNVNIGSLHYAFNSLQLEPGFSVDAVEVPHVAVRVVLLGHQFHKYLAAQVSYMRPVNYVSYKSINGDKQDHHVWMHYGSLTLLFRSTFSAGRGRKLYRNPAEWNKVCG